MEKPRISANELAEKLVSSRKIMKKVDNGDYSKGNINTDILTKAPEELSEQTMSRQATRPVGKVDINKVNQSKLPDAIKKAMIENPIPEISLNDGLDIDMVNKARKLMEQDGTLSRKQESTPQQRSYSLNENTQTTIPNNLEALIENTIRKILDEKLTQILNAQAGTNLNENLAIKVGDSIFTGKITKVKNTK